MAINETLQKKGALFSCNQTLVLSDILELGIPLFFPVRAPLWFSMSNLHELTVYTPLLARPRSRRNNWGDAQHRLLRKYVELS